MAVVEMIQSHYKTKAAVKKIINYIFDPEKTSPEIMGGVFCSPATAVQEFLLTKALYKKEKGRQVIHLTQAFAPTDNVTPEMVKEIADKFLQHACFKGFQVAYAVHTNKSHLHTHFVINTVNYETGKKWQQTKEELKSLKQYSDDLCREYGLSVIEQGQKRQMDRGEYRSRQRQVSYLYETSLAVKLAMAHADSQERFMANMKRQGYKVEWLPGKKEITFTTPEGQKVPDYRLTPKNSYSKESILAFLENNTVSKNDEKEFADIVLAAGKMQQKTQTTCPLSQLKEIEQQQQTLKEQVVIMATEQFLDAAINPDGIGQGSLGENRVATLADWKDYLAEKKKGRGMAVESDGEIGI